MYEYHFTPSTSERWLKCSGSAIRERKIDSDFSPNITPTKPLNEHTELGVKLHDVACKYFDLLFDGEELKAQELLEQLDKPSRDNVTFYINQIKKISNCCFVRGFEQKVSLEEWTFDTSQYRVDFFGLSADTLYVVDYKTGNEKLISPIDNPQLMLYALGLLWNDDIPDSCINEIRLVIIQPAMFKKSWSWTITREDLLAWGDKLRKKIVDIKYNNKIEFNTGEHCLRCPLRKKCCKFLNEIDETGAEAFDLNIQELTSEKKSELYQKIQVYKQFVNELEKEIEEEVKEKKYEIDGYKLVEKKTNRKIVNEGKAIEILHKNNFTDEQILTKPKLKSPAQLEKTLGVEEVQNSIGYLIFKPEAELTLAKNEDYRPERTERRFKFSASRKDAGGHI